MSGVDWTGGQIEVVRESSGWGILQRTKDGGLYGMDWQKHRTAAIRSGQSYAKARGAKLLVEA